MTSKFTHMDENNRGQMVDVSKKEISERTAVARGRILLKKETIDAIKDLKTKKGDVLAIAQVAAIQGAKQCFSIIPMVHPLLLTSINVDFEFQANYLYCQVRVSCQGKTGVEMEALTGVSAGLLTVYDMCKSLDKSMVIEDIKLMKKTGGKSGDFVREEDV
ncbi:MAG: cyclic pyranopterin monophosphate synthase MoaC [Tissierellia bacterium]|nr:cyclic pyranopterin monophosphate synthase MoaC [Tissierellia bacterium]